MLKGIDVSSHDNFNGSVFKANTEAAYRDSDFLIVKATQGTSYVYKGCDSVYQRAKRDGKLLGFYHYAGGNNPVSEADYFVSQTKGYFGEAIPVLDWESHQNKSWGNTSWCRRFVNRVHDLTGVWCMIYIQASERGQAANCANDCALWLAGYPDNRNNWNIPAFRYKTNPWPTWTLWQYSSSNGATDRDVAQLDRAAWLKIAGSKVSEPAPQPKPDPRASLPENLKPFVDVEPGAWYVDVLSQAVAKGYFHGYDSTHIGPNDALTRGQAVCIIANAAGAQFEHPYNDVTASPYYYDAVAWAKEQSIINGELDSFRPNDACTRAEFACMLCNWRHGTNTGEPTGYADWGQVPDWARTSVAWAVEKGIMGNGGNLRPNDACTRAEGAAMLVRA